MITSLAKGIVEKLKKETVISNADEDLYIYGLFVAISFIFYFFEVLLFGILFHNVVESILFYATFYLLRSYAGGVHASKEASCLLFTSLSLVGSVAAIKAVTVINPLTLSVVTIFLATICILILCPLDTPEKELSPAEKKHFWNISCILLLVIISIAVIAFCVGRQGLFYAIMISLVLESILLILGIIKAHNQSC